VDSAGSAFGPRLNLIKRGGLLTWPMATQQWPDWLVPGGERVAWSPWPESARWHGRPGLAARLPCPAVGDMSTRTVRGGHRTRRMLTRLTKGVGHRRGGGWGDVSSKAVAQSRQRGTPASGRRRAGWRQLGGQAREGHQRGAHRSEGSTEGRPERLNDVRTSAAGGQC
jgi:hypothetical protein